MSEGVITAEETCNSSAECPLLRRHVIEWDGVMFVDIISGSLSVITFELQWLMRAKTREERA